MELMFWLLVGHVLADYPLQGDFLAKAKNRFAPIPGVPWWQALSAHALIHGGMVGLITGYWWFGLFEFAAHWRIDYAKCKGDISFNEDQYLHVLCKFVWVVWVLLWQN